MNESPVYQALALVAATLLLLPFPVAIFSGWVPPRLGDRSVALPYAWATLCVYALVPLNAVPRLLGASAAVVTLCTGAGPLLSLAAVTCLVRSYRSAWNTTLPKNEG
ncbi:MULTISPECIES: hypothetical protein [unclassified Streptomyces]|uniref:hypothetical protein n=1 Tax=unclassified Streptomyces TaxID=2593676 RepID=UPI002E1AE3D3